MEYQREAELDGIAERDVEQINQGGIRSSGQNN
jgi:hypothetical protein